MFILFIFLLIKKNLGIYVCINPKPTEQVAIKNVQFSIISKTAKNPMDGLLVFSVLFCFIKKKVVF